MLFSIIIPTYNREKIVVRAIESILVQTITDFEIIVVDDGSTDNTECVVKAIDDPRVLYLKQPNKGATVARNNGIKHAKGIYVSFLDSDDIWYPEMLEKQLEKYKSDNEISCVYSDLTCITDDGKIVPFWNPTKIEGYIYKEALSQGFLSPTIVLSAKRECFEAVGMFDENMPASQDDDICFKLSKKYKFGYIPLQLAGVYTNVDNRISGSSNKVSLGWWMLWNKYENDVVELCGKKVMAAHFLKCLCMFLANKNRQMLSEAISKYEMYASLNLIQRFLMNLSLYLKGEISVLFRRLFLLSIRFL